MSITLFYSLIMSIANALVPWVEKELKSGEIDDATQQDARSKWLAHQQSGLALWAGPEWQQSKETPPLPLPESPV